MKVVLSCVGNRDPIAEDTHEEGAALTLVRRIRPDVVVLFPTRDLHGKPGSGTESRARIMEEMLAYEEFGDVKCVVQPMTLQDPTVHRDVLQALRRGVHDALSLFPGQSLEIHVNVSSGTPQMHASWLLLANSGYLPNARLYQVANPKWGRTAVEERVSEVEFSFVREDLLVERSLRNLRSGGFELARRDFEEISSITAFLERASRYEILADIMEAYVEWDRMDYRFALDRLRGAARRASRFVEMTSLACQLETQVSALGRLAAGEPVSLLFLVDVYHNAFRRFARGEYADCLSRCWRLMEGIMYWRLVGLGVDPWRPTASKNSDAAAFVSRSRGRDPNRPLFFQECERVLRTFDATWLECMQSLTIIPAVVDPRIEETTVGVCTEKVRKARNHAVVGHGSDPVSRGLAALSLSLARTCLAHALEGRVAEVDEYAFSLAAIDNALAGVVA